MKIQVSASDILLTLGYKDTSANEFILEQAELAALKANSIARYQKVFKKIKIESIQGDKVTLETGDCFVCKSLASGIKGCSHLIVALTTIGSAMDEEICRAFKSEDPLMGMMLDAAGSKMVSYYTNQIWREFTEAAAANVGTTHGFTPGSGNFDLSQQKVLFNILDTESIGVTLNESMLMTPAKSISVVYGTGINIEGNSCASHSCKGCPRKDCMMRDDRQVEIKFHLSDGDRTVKTSVGSKLLDVIKENDIPMEFPCNGRGTCGGCAVRFVKIPPAVLPEDEKHLSQRKIDNGWRLACKVEIAHPLELYIEQDSMQILSEAKSGDTEVLNYGIAIDIGTTTVVCHLIDSDDLNIIDTVAAVNRQRRYGADVASRILHEMSDTNGKEHLNSAIIGQLNEMTAELLERNNVEKLSQVVAVGNTIMTHILLGYSVSGLGQAPYTPVSLERAAISCESLGINLDCDITAIEGMDSYVGADISVGAAYCGLMENDAYSILLDLGTNGEIALGNKDNLFCCATAAGPAFEAVNIHNGMSGLPGAVSEFSYEDGAYQYKTIGNKKPLGICGSGVLDITATLVENGVVDLTGRLLADKEGVAYDENVREYFKVAQGRDDDIIFTAKDVREIQLAKAAIAAGINTLIETAGIAYEDISKIYIAGGFGNYMNIESALAIGLIPKELRGKTEAAGNTAAQGAIYCHKQEFANKVAAYVAKSNHVDLSTSMIFQNHYIESMGFDG